MRKTAATSRYRRSPTLAELRKEMNLNASNKRSLRLTKIGDLKKTISDIFPIGLEFVFPQSRHARRPRLFFYAQVEEQEEPSYNDKPVIVCVYSARGGDSGAVNTANYIVRKLGVKSGIP